MAQPQEDYIKRLEEGMQAQASRGVAKAEKGFAVRGLGRHIGSQAAVGRLASEYAQKIGETTGAVRHGAAEAEKGRVFEAGETAKGRTFAATQAQLDREAAMRQLEKSKERDVLDYVGAIF